MQSRQRHMTQVTRASTHACLFHLLDMHMPHAPCQVLLLVRPVHPCNNVLKLLPLLSVCVCRRQALPIIMSGRDCIGIAKTGSGKTLAFVLPMLRHIKDQPPLANGDGPIALIMAPTRELVAQISKVRCDR